MRILLALGVLLVVLWAVLWIGFHLVTGLIHLLLIVGVAFLIWGLVRRGVSAVTRR